MPRLTQWYVRIAFLYLLLALLLAIALALRAPLRLSAVFAALGPVYVHLFLVGWVTQLIFGVVFWLFPPPETGDAPTWPGWMTLVLLNAGLLIRAVAEPRAAAQPGTIWGWLLVLSALLQWGGGLAFIFATWPRVRERSRKSR
jgi:hypothetical protein